MSPPYRRTQLNRAYSCCCGLPLPRAMLLLHPSSLLPLLLMPPSHLLLLLLLA